MNRQIRKKVEKNSINFRLSGIVLLLILGLVIYNPLKPVKGDNSDLVQILPLTYTLYNVESGEWHNVEKALSQDLGPKADSNEFTKENSAYPMDIQEISELEILGSLLALDEFATGSEETLIEETPIIEETKPEDNPPVEQTPPIEELPREEVPSADKPILIERYLEFSDFAMPSDFTNDGKKIENVELRLSLAVGNGTENEKLVIEYSDKSSWKQLAEINLSRSECNRTNNGYWLFALPIFDDWNDLNELQIRFSYSAIKPNADAVLDGFAYLDALWLEVQYQNKTTDTSEAQESPNTELQLNEQDLNLINQLQSASLLQPKEERIEFVNPKRVFYWNEEPEFELPSLTSNETLDRVWQFFGSKNQIKEALLTLPNGNTIPADIDFIDSENPKIRIKKLVNFQPGAYSFKVIISRAGTDYLAEIQFDWQIGTDGVKMEVRQNKDAYVFSLEGTPIKTKKHLDWHRDEFEKNKNNENSDINVNASNSGNESSLDISGNCTMAYFVILVYRNADDYEKNPASFVYNKAFPCVNNKYQYTLNDLPPLLKDGTYYLLVGEEGETGSWQPITALQTIKLSPKK